MNDFVQLPEEETTHLPDSENTEERKYDNETKNQKKTARQDPLDAIAWALILIWAGLVFLVFNVGWVDKLNLAINLPENAIFLGLRVWPVIALGAGVILLIETFTRMLVPAFNASNIGQIFLAFLFLALGLDGIFEWKFLWPLVLVCSGMVILANAFIKLRK
jgi:hypothetical protein